MFVRGLGDLQEDWGYICKRTGPYICKRTGAYICKGTDASICKRTGAYICKGAGAYICKGTGAYICKRTRGHSSMTSFLLFPFYKTLLLAYIVFNISVLFISLWLACATFCRLPGGSRSSQQVTVRLIIIIIRF
jgi:hypothetical protein